MIWQRPLYLYFLPFWSNRDSSLSSVFVLSHHLLVGMFSVSIMFRESVQYMSPIIIFLNLLSIGLSSTILRGVKNLMILNLNPHLESQVESKCLLTYTRQPTQNSSADLLILLALSGLYLIRQIFFIANTRTYLIASRSRRPLLFP